MKKLSIFLLALFASAGITQAAIVDGSCGDNLTWSLNTQDSTLTITGMEIQILLLGMITNHTLSMYLCRMASPALENGLFAIAAV